MLRGFMTPTCSWESIFIDTKYWQDAYLGFLICDPLKMALNFPKLFFP